MPKAPRSVPTPAKSDLARAPAKLLVELSGPEVYAFPVEERGVTILAIAARRKDVSLRIASTTMAAALALTRADLARWETPGRSGAARLVITEAGRAKARRLAAPAGVEPFIAQHVRPQVQTISVEGAPQRVLRDSAESPLAWLAGRRGRDGKALIDAAGFQAGERLRADLTLSQMLPRVTASWESPTSGGRGGIGPETYSDHVIAARQRVSRALEYAGEFSGLLMDVCGFLKGLERVESERGWPPRSAKVVLVLALARLARHYGYAQEARGKAGTGRILQWGAADYRPRI